MATINGLTKERMLAIEAESVTGARLDVVTHHLILVKHDLSEIDVGNLQGPVGPTGPPPSLATTVVTPATFGAPGVVGSSALAAHGDHDHGLPAPLLASLLTAFTFQYVPSSSALVALDTTSLTISFVAPPSGKVILRAFGGSYSSSGMYVVGFLNHAGGAQVGTSVKNYSGSAGSNPMTFACGITGLTPGTTYRYDLAMYQAAAGQFYVTSSTGTGIAPAGAEVVIEVLAA